MSSPGRYNTQSRRPSCSLCPPRPPTRRETLRVSRTSTAPASGPRHDRAWKRSTDGRARQSKAAAGRGAFSGLWEGHATHGRDGDRATILGRRRPREAGDEPNERKRSRLNRTSWSSPERSQRRGGSGVRLTPSPPLGLRRSPASPPPFDREVARVALLTGLPARIPRPTPPRCPTRASARRAPVR